MLLNVDIGNTSTGFAVTHKGRVKAADEVLYSDHTPAELKKELTKKLAGLRKQWDIHDAMMCSVVPRRTRVLKSIIKDTFRFTPKEVGRTIPVPIRNRYKDQTQVGADRLVCAYAVRELYGAPAIVIDLGTAITFDIVTSRGDYDGGMIVPGIKMSTESLYKKTALLPEVKLIHKPRNLIGKTTEESILSGVFYGYGEMCSGLIDKISRHLKGKPVVIVTGGFADLMKSFIHPQITAIEPYLIFKGLSRLYAKHLKG